MKQPVCIYFDSHLATRAAAIARQQGAVAKVTVAPLKAQSDHGVVNLFIVESDPSDHQKVIRSISESKHDYPLLASQALRCPNCHSLNIEYPEHPKRSPVLRTLGSVIESVGRWINLRENGRFHCLGCGQVWRPEDTDRPGEAANACSPPKSKAA
jgi:hypothetical protein